MIADLLYQLQQVDETTQSKTRRLAEVEALIGESEELRRARSDLTQAQEALNELGKKQREQELALGAVAAKLQAEESRLYGGRVTNTRELAGLQKAARYLRQRRAEMEDSVLDTMMACEEAVDHTAVRQASLADVEARWKRDQAMLVAERDELQTAIAEANDRRLELVNQIPAHTLATYDYLLRTKGFAVAPVENGMCIGCRVSLSAVDRQRVLRDELMTCSNCGRILVVL